MNHGGGGRPLFYSYLVPVVNRAFSVLVARHPDTMEVIGSIPIWPLGLYDLVRLLFRLCSK